MTALAIRQGTDAWLEYRRAHVTATDAAVIAGETGSVVELWAQKRGLVPEPEFDEETRQLMDDGSALQPYLVDLYARRTGRKVRNIHTTRESSEWPIAACSPDGEVIGEPVGLEAKMSTAAKWRTSEDVPGDVFAQVQWQMFVTGWERVDVVALVFGRPRIIPVDRDQGYIGDLLAVARQFHQWVESGERPPLDGSENARHVLTALHPRGDGTGLVPAPPDVVQLIADIAAAKDEIRGSTELLKTMENALRALIGDGDGFKGDWGQVTYRNNADSVRVNWPAVATAYRELLANAAYAMHEGKSIELASVLSTDLDAIESIHTQTAEGPRVLRLSVKEPT